MSESQPKMKQGVFTSLYEQRRASPRRNYGDSTEKQQLSSGDTGVRINFDNSTSG